MNTQSKKNKQSKQEQAGAAIWASIRQAERHAHVTNGTIRAAVKRGELKAYRRRGGKGALVDLRDVDAWIKETWDTQENELNKLVSK